eukprot:763899-Hanusia_phi.AAC.5
MALSPHPSPALVPSLFPPHPQSFPFSLSSSPPSSLPHDRRTCLGERFSAICQELRLHQIASHPSPL